MKLLIISSLLFAMIFSLGSMNFADAIPCDTYERENGKTICLSESTAVKLMERGWNITKISVIVEDDTLVEITNVKPETVVLTLASPIEFVDDGRDIKRSVLQRAPAPWPMYDEIMTSMENGLTSMSSNESTVTIPTIPHEKYSINPKQGFYLEDWLPTFIPSGQKLLYSSTGYDTFELNGREYESYGAYYKFVPTTFVLHPNATSYDLQVSKGFAVGVGYRTLPFDEVVDNIEFISEIRAKQSGNIGGFVDMTRDGKTVMAFEGSNDYNHYQATLAFHPDENTSVTVSSNYHTLDELIPIFNSVMK